MAFPNTPILDPFTGTGALGSGWRSPIVATYTAWERDTDVAKANAGNSFSSSYWTPQYAADQEVFATISAMPVAGDCRLHCRIQNPGIANYTSYHVTFHATNTFLNKTLAGTRTTLKTYGASWIFAAGDQVGLSVIGDQLQIYKNGSPLAGDVPFTDTSIVGPGFIGIWSQNDASIRLDDFGGGDFVNRNFAPALGGWGGG